MRFRIAFTATVMVAALTTSAIPAWAFHDDVHYHMTYLTARLVGYTPEQAYRIAAADLAVNYSPATEPTQMSAAQWAAGEREDAPERQRPRWRFHSYFDSTKVPHDPEGPADLAGVTEGIARRAKELQTAAEAGGNPGVWLHFRQDELAHQYLGSGFGSELDPVDPAVAAEAPARRGAALLPVAGPTDWLAIWTGSASEEFPLQRVREMAETAAEAMRSYGATASPRQRFGQPTTAQLLDIIAKLSFVNPLPFAGDERWSYGYYAAARRGLAEFAAQHYYGLDKPPSIIPQQEAKFAEVTVGPNLQVAQNMAQVLLKGYGTPELIPDYTKARKEFTLDARGNVAPEVLDRWVITGALRVTLKAPNGKAQGPVDVLIKAPPTRQDAEEYELAKLTRIDVPSNSLVENLPMGEVLVEVRRGEDIAAQELVKLDKRQQEVVIDVGRPAATGPAWVLKEGFPQVNSTNAPVKQRTDGAVEWKETTLKELSPTRLAASILVHRVDGMESTYDFEYNIAPAPPSVLRADAPTDIRVEGTLTGGPRESLWPFFRIWSVGLIAHLDREPNSAVQPGFRHDMLGRMGIVDGNWVTSSHETVHLSAAPVDAITGAVNETISMDLSLGGTWVLHYEWERREGAPVAASAPTTPTAQQEAAAPTTTVSATQPAPTTGGAETSAKPLPRPIKLPRLGIEAQTRPGPDGHSVVVIASLTEDSVLQGVAQPGDEVLAIDGVEVTDAAQLRSLVAQKPNAETVRLRLHSGDRAFEVSALLLKAK